MVFNFLKRKSKKEDKLEYIVKNIVTDDFVAFHCEVYENTIVEISCIKVENSIIVDEFDSLIKSKIKLSKSFSESTGITNEMLAYSPDLSSVLKDVYSFVDNKLMVGYSPYKYINTLIKNFNDLYYSFKSPVTDICFFYKKLESSKKEIDIDDIYQKYCNSSLPDKKSINKSLAIANLYLDFPIHNREHLDGIQQKKDISLNISKGEKLISSGKIELAYNLFKEMYNNNIYKLKVFENIIYLLEKQNKKNEIEDFLLESHHIATQEIKDTKLYEKYYKGLNLNE
jgi:DNA polymerase III alpha subunit (gram-positive type)